MRFIFVCLCLALASYVTSRPVRSIAGHAAISFLKPRGSKVSLSSEHGITRRRVGKAFHSVSQSRRSSIQSSSRQYNFDRCEDDSECAGDRRCFAITDDLELERCPPGAPCICANENVNPNSCSLDSDCEPDKEVCTERVRDTTGATIAVNVCVSKNPSDESGGDAGGAGADGADDDDSGDDGEDDDDGGDDGEDDDDDDDDGGDDGEDDDDDGDDGDNNNGEDNVCIAIQSLKHLPPPELVFEQHRRAIVLCDEAGSCATPGHMVRYKGRGMMMRSFCDIVGGCVRKRMMVNSPKYRRGMAIPSRSDGMEFTAFAARHATMAEEAILSFAMRLRL